ncbi:hypothetical protein B0H66DRAFT_127310 [Apodospora peruviana]|uniref:Uncharacterized protein n=1 Tax=Apodospora peruviana TaxID=516989 RepID=A0AAE0MAM6_9PEZI|nr:hypothetical protein B0H66DRAFT_127310 [Apodospora peruviana]
MSPLQQHADGGVWWLESRGDTSWTPQNNTTGGAGNRLFQSAATNSTNQMIINEFRFAAAKSIRTSTIILATFNTVTAFATALGILIDSYYRKRRNDKKFKFRRNGFTFVPAVEVFPLVLSFGIVVQGITFAVAQSTGLDSLVGLGCTLVAQMMLPAVFIVPYIQLVFALEITMRGLQKKQPFAPRGKWTVTICLTIIGLLILTNFLVANFDRSPNFCLTSLFWFVAHYSVGCFAVLVGITSTLLVCVVIVFVRLHRSTKIEVTERVAASRMVYYMALGAISSGFMIPYFFVMSFVDQRGGNSNALTLSMIASVVANVSGLMTGGLYLFLKSNTLSTIGPRDKVAEYERRRQKYKIRHYEPRDEDSHDAHMMQPVAGSGSLRRVDSDASLISTEKEEEARRPPSSTYSGQGPNPLRSNAVYPTSIIPRTPEPAKLSSMSPAIGHMRKRSYSLFPNNAPSIKSVTLLPATTYSPNTKESAADRLQPPPSMRNLANRHRRDSSLISSATVQIGLRLSSVEDMPPVAQNKVIAGDGQVHTLDCPNIQKDKILSPNRRPAALNTSFDAQPALPDESPKRDPVKNAKMKTLPPVPRTDDGESDGEDDTAVESDSDSEKAVETLSPTVYSPVKTAKLPSPRGVGFGMPSTATGKTNSGGELRSPPMSAPLRRIGTGDTTPGGDARAWI